MLLMAENACGLSLAPSAPLDDVLNSFSDAGLLDGLFTLDPAQPPRAMPNMPCMPSQPTLVKSKSNGSDKSHSSDGNKTKPGAKRPRRRLKHQIAELEEKFQEQLEKLQKLAAENQALSDRMRIMEAAVQCRNEQLQRVEEVRRLQARAADGPPSPSGSQPLDISLYNNDVLTMENVQTMNTMTVELLIERYKGVAARLSSALLISTEPGIRGDMAGKELDMFIDNTRRMGKYIKLLNPNISAAYGRHVSLEGVMAPESHWLSILGILELSSQQLADISALYDLYSRGQQDIAQERQQVVQAVQQVQAEIEALDFQLQWPQLDLRKMELATRLNRIVAREKCIVLLVDEVLFSKIFSLRQFARMLVHSFPYVPDACAFTAAVAKQHQGTALMAP